MMSMDDCQRFEALLDSQMLDDIPLSTEEKDFFENHAESCNQCAASAAIVLNMQDTAAEAEEYDPSDAYLEKMARRVLEKEAAANPWAELVDGLMSFLTPRQWVMAGASAACLVMVMAAWISLSHRPQAPYLEYAQVARVEGQAALSDQPSQHGSIYRQGDEIAVADGALWMNFNNGTKALVKKNSAIRLQEASRQKTHFMLQKGQVVFHVSPLQKGQEFLIESEAGKLNVIGTTFEVGLDSRGEFIRVTEGKVRFESKQGKVSLIRAGQGLDPDHGVYTLPEPARTRVDAELGGGAAPTSEPRDARESEPLVAQPDREPPAAVMPLETPTRSQPAPSSRTRAPAPRKTSPLASSRATSASRTPPAAAEPEERPGIERPAPGYSPSGSPMGSRPSAVASFKPTISEMLQQSRQLRQDKDFQGVVSIYQKIIELYPASAEARSCWVWMGKVQIENLGDPTKALRSFQTYLRNAPEGSLGEEALWGSAQALRALERFDEEMRALKLFETRFPESSYLPRVRARLQDLQTP